MSEVIVVDNASGDGTAEFVATAYPQVTLIRLNANEGVGGGYSAGLHYALYEKNYDWVWMLDQDSVPRPDTLAKLLRTWEETDNRERIGIIAPLSVDASTGVPYPLFLWQDRQIEMSRVDLDSPRCCVDMVISSGSLVRNAAVRAAGLPRKEFFMDWVDFEYCLRLRRLGFQIVVAAQCRMPHTIGSPRTVWWLGKRRQWITHPAWRDYYKVRNRAFVVWHEMPSVKAKVFVLIKFIAQATGTILFDSEKLQRLKFMSIGLLDGIRGKLENEVRPHS